MPTFNPPVSLDNPTVLPQTTGVAYMLFRHFTPRARGRTVLKIDGVYGTYDWPYAEVVDSATEVYLGGHVYEVSQTVADALTAAGYTVG